MKKTVEIGELLRIDLKKERERALVHVRGNPILEARLAERLISEEDLTQREVAKALKLSQPQVSRRLRLLEELHPLIIEKVLAGKVRVSTAYQLSRLPKAEQLKFKKPTLKAVESKVRELTLSSDLMSLLEEKLSDQDKTETPTREIRCPKCGEIIQISRSEHLD